MKKTKKIWFQMSAALAVAWVASCGFAATTVKIISSAMRESDPTIMDVEYCVKSDSAKVDTRALAFQDGVRSFANVVRPETFLDGSVIGDGVAANVTNKFSWRVSADWKIDLAKVSIEVLAKKPGEGLVPLHWVTISKNGEAPALRVSTTDLTDAQALDALYWLYADKDETLTLTDGVLSDKNGALANGTSMIKYTYTWTKNYIDFDYRENVGRHIYEKMGYHSTVDFFWLASYARATRRVAMSSSYGYAYNIKMGSGLYMVINLNSHSFDLPVTYLDAAPKNGWSDEYKTNKLVLRRIDASDGTTYYAGVFEVTEAQWYKVMGGDATTSTKPKVCVTWNQIRGGADVYNWPTVTGVARNSFMGQLRLMTGLQTFDLPTEDEWEYAARAGVATKYLCGDTETGLDDYAWYSANSDENTHNVGVLKPNAWGLYDVNGNVWEWSLSLIGSNRIHLGSAYDGNASSCAFSLRAGYPPRGWSDTLGFRLYCRAEGK